MTLQAASRGEFLRAWFFVALWTAVVWTLSSDGFSASSTARVIGPILRWFFPGISQEGFELVHFMIRKSAHLTEYAVLALLALGFVLVVASVDELRQSRSRVRTGSPADVAFDGGGGPLALVGALLRERRFGVGGSRGYRSPGSIFSDSRGASSHGEDL